MTQDPIPSDRTGLAIIGADMIGTGSIVDHLLRDWPQATPVFLRHKMNCVGCSLAAFDTLGDALRIYGLPSEPFLAELRLAIQQAPPQGSYLHTRSKT